MQKLCGRNTYTPTSAVPACGSVAEGLNSSERVGAVSFSLKTPHNNSEEHLQTWVCLGLKPLKLPIIQEVCAIPPTTRAVGILARV